jgi:hypothetical protein
LSENLKKTGNLERPKFRRLDDIKTVLKQAGVRIWTGYNSFTEYVGIRSSNTVGSKPTSDSKELRDLEIT